MSQYIPAIIGLFGVLVGGLIAAFKEYWLIRRKESKSTKFVCIRVVSALERFGESCVDVIDDGERREDGCLYPTVTLPTFDIESLEVNWELLPHLILYRIHDLPNRINSAKRAISAASEFADPPDYEDFFESREIHFISLGIEAFNLASSIRLYSSLPDFDRREWDPVTHLKARQFALQQKIDKRRQIGQQ